MRFNHKNAFWNKWNVIKLHKAKSINILVKINKNNIVI